MQNHDLKRVGISPFVISGANAQDKKLRFSSPQHKQRPQAHIEEQEDLVEEAFSGSIKVNFPLEKQSRLNRKSAVKSMATIPSVFEQSRTIKSITLSKDRLVSSRNILQVPIEYDIQGLKRKTQDATKLFCAIRNFYEHQETMDKLDREKRP